MGNDLAHKDIDFIITSDCIDCGPYCEDLNVSVLKFVDKYIDIEKQNKELCLKNKNLLEENTDLKYRPGGPGYYEAKDNFESNKN